MITAQADKNQIVVEVEMNEESETGVLAELTMIAAKVIKKSGLNPRKAIMAFMSALPLAVMAESGDDDE